MQNESTFFVQALHRPSQRQPEEVDSFYMQIWTLRSRILQIWKKLQIFKDLKTLPLFQICNIPLLSAPKWHTMCHHLTGQVMWGCVFDRFIHTHKAYNWTISESYKLCCRKATHFCKAIQIRVKRSPCLCFFHPKLLQEKKYPDICLRSILFPSSHG